MSVLVHARIASSLKSFFAVWNDRQARGCGLGIWPLCFGCLLFVVYCLLFVDCCLLIVVCCLLFVFYCLLFVVCCLLLFEIVLKANLRSQGQQSDGLISRSTESSTLLLAKVAVVFVVVWYCCS